MSTPHKLLGLLLAATVAACGSDPQGTPDAGGGGDAGVDAGSGPEVVCTEPTAVPCEDQLYQQLDLKTKVAEGGVTSAETDGVWVSEIDATAGGAFSVTDAFTYLAFTDQGLEQLEIDDDTALTSMDWDIAFRRFIIRLNGGDSGPSCVAGVRLPGTPDFASVTAPPDGASWYLDDYFTASCGFVDDGSGLPSAPATVLGGYYAYTGCLTMTGNVYVVRLADGRYVKLTVEGYYSPMSAQTYCDENDAMATGATSAVFTVRWAFL